MKVEIKAGNTIQATCGPGNRIGLYLFPEVILSIDYPIWEQSVIGIDFVWIAWYVALKIRLK